MKYNNLTRYPKLEECDTALLTGKFSYTGG